MQALWGNLLNWTDGKCQAAWTLRYHQAIRLRAAKLIVDEINEASEVVKELIERIVSDSEKHNKLCVVLLELKQHLSRILQERSAPGKIKTALQSAVEKGVNMDKDFEDSLKIAIENARNSTGGYVYLKQWSLADGTRWFKVGITNNPNRRDAEQNVLPVTAVTLRLMETQSMDQAAAIERALHQQLAAQKVTGAGNRELFHLDDAQLAALMAAMERSHPCPGHRPCSAPDGAAVGGDGPRHISEPNFYLHWCLGIHVHLDRFALIHLDLDRLGIAYLHLHRRSVSHAQIDRSMLNHFHPQAAGGFNLNRPWHVQLPLDLPAELQRLHKAVLQLHLDWMFAEAHQAG